MALEHNFLGMPPRPAAPEGRLLPDLETEEKAPTNATVAGFLSGPAIRESDVHCYHNTPVTTANVVAVRASLQNVGLGALHDVDFAVEETNDLSLTALRGPGSSVSASITEQPVPCLSSVMGRGQSPPAYSNVRLHSTPRRGSPLNATAPAYGASTRNPHHKISLNTLLKHVTLHHDNGPGCSLP